MNAKRSSAPTSAVTFCFLLAAAASPSARADIITIRADPWCPYVCEAGSEQPGYLIELAQRAFEAAGHQVDYQYLPWPRAIAEVRRGAFAGLAGAGKGDAPDFIFPRSMGIHVPALAVRKGSGFVFNGAKSLENILLGTVVGVGAWGGGLDEYIAANKDNPARIDYTGGEDPYPVTLRKLLAGRIDAVANSGIVLERLVEELDIADKVEIIRITENDDVYIAFSPALEKSPEYVRILDEGVARMRASGELDRILARYDLTDWVR